MAAARAACTSPCVGGGLFLLISLVYIQFILRVGPLGPFDAVIEPPEPPLCLLTGGPALVVALPLLEQTAAAASAALAERLEPWQGTPPCRRDDGATTLSLVLAWSGAAQVDAQEASAGPQLQRRAAELLRPVRHCLGEPQLLDGRAIRAHQRSRRRSGAARRAAIASVGGAAVASAVASSGGNAPAERLRLRLPASSTLRENTLFLAVLAHARRHSAALLWLSPHTTPLRPRWLEALRCEAAAAPDAWLLGSTLLMDCDRRGGWEPPPTCCTAGHLGLAAANVGGRSAWPMGATLLFRATAEGLDEYVREWRASTLWREPFHVALSSRMWQAYHESRQRGIRHRFVATDLIADLGEEGVPAAALAAARAGGSGFGGALLLATRNSSWPVEPDAGEDDASLAATRSRLPALLGLSPPSPPPQPPLGIASASPPGAATNASLSASVGTGGGTASAGGGEGGADSTATDAQARAFASLHGVTRREERPGVRFAEEHLFPTVHGAAAGHGGEHGAGRDASLELDESAEEVRHTQARGEERGGGGAQGGAQGGACHAQAALLLCSPMPPMPPRPPMPHMPPIPPMPLTPPMPRTRGLSRRGGWPRWPRSPRAAMRSRSCYSVPRSAAPRRRGDRRTWTRPIRVAPAAASSRGSRASSGPPSLAGPLGHAPPWGGA